MNRQKNDLEVIERQLPDIAGTAAQIATYARVPIMTRLDYLSARGQAMYTSGTDSFSQDLSAALELKRHVWEAMR